ncbi:MAG: tRNA-binding protein [Acidobacteria bacterium]|nr:tRNA-binding protein [Acidobacteriota bacterium]MYG74031.1 tRNA-binding protein [Acidobacteriota bacterium]
MPDIALPKEQITLEDLTRIDIRAGTILEVSDVPNSRKLVRLTVDLGFATRTVVVGMKQERGNPKEIEGLQALFVVNLPPRRMAGVLSEAMLFDLGYSDGIVPALAIPERPVPNGTRAG